jgi:hypothetical protein
MQTWDENVRTHARREDRKIHLKMNSFIID